MITESSNEGVLRPNFSNSYYHSLFFSLYHAWKNLPLKLMKSICSEISPGVTIKPKRNNRKNLVQYKLEMKKYGSRMSYWQKTKLVDAFSEKTFLIARMTLLLLLLLLLLYCQTFIKFSKNLIISKILSKLVENGNLLRALNENKLV